MNLQDFGIHHFQIFTQQMPRSNSPVNYLANHETVAMLENHLDVCAGRMRYAFTDNDLARHGSDKLVTSILDSIENHHADLKLYVTTGEFPSGFMSYIKCPFYRLTSARNHCYIDFYFKEYADGLECKVLIFFVSQSYQGSFYNVKDFLINRFAKTLFNLSPQKVLMVSGIAMSSQFPVRQSRDWRDKKTKDGKTTRLVRLYEKLGFRRDESKPNCVYLFPEAGKN